jgi:predicted nucleic acid-binding Zn ribbon protein
MVGSTGKNRVNRDTVLRDLWLKHGCPEKMTIRVKSTGETITVLDGLIQSGESPGHGLIAAQKPQGCATVRPLDVDKAERRVTWPVTDNRHCEACGIEFPSVRADARYCSPRCRQTAKRKHERERRSKAADELLARVFNGTHTAAQEGFTDRNQEALAS